MDDLKTVFISYSHKDRELLESLSRHFAPLKNKIDFWDDSKIYAGMKWKQEIDSALKKAKVAVLFLSADFFNSDFIMKNELPFILEAEQNGLTVLSVLLKPCLFQFYEGISQIQFIHDASKSIIQMTEAERELVWTNLILRINDILY